jgi:hypothetical protein
MRVSLLVLVAACGRIAFDPITGDNGSGVMTDGGGTGDGKATGDGGETGTGADAATACATSGIPVVVGRSAAVTTCQGFDAVDGCSTAGMQEVLFEFKPTVTASYSFAARNPGGMNTPADVGFTDATCMTLVSACAGILGRNLTAGTTNYIVVEARTGGCVTIELEITQN